MNRESLEHELAVAIRNMQLVARDELIADVLFTAWSATQQLEGVVGDVLEDASIICDRFVYDWYDRSLELFGCSDEWEPTEQQIALIAKLGFARFWVHPGDQVDRTVERHYTCRPQT